MYTSWYFYTESAFRIELYIHYERSQLEWKCYSPDQTLLMNF